MIIFSNTSEEDLEDIVKQLGKPGSKLQLLVNDEFRKFQLSEDKYLHVYSNHASDGYLVTRTGDYILTQTETDYQSCEEFVMLARRSEDFQVRWASNIYDYTDRVNLMKMCKQLNVI